MNIVWKIKNYASLEKDELYDIMHLRQVVFIVEQDAPYIDADYKDQQSWHVLGYDSQHKLVAHARIVQPDISYKEPSIGRVVTHPDIRRKGIGETLMQKSIDTMEEVYQTSSCRISAQTYLIPFYQRFGFQVCSDEYLEDGLPHREMIRD